MLVTMNTCNSYGAEIKNMPKNMNKHGVKKFFRERDNIIK